MLRYLARRILQMVPVILGAIALIYLALFVFPGDPVQALIGERAATPEFREAITEKYGLDDPLPVQIATYVSNIVRLDFGESFAFRRPVLDIIKQRAPVSFRMATVGLVFLLVMGITSGTVSAWRRYSLSDGMVTVIAILLVSLPVFVLGLLLQLMALKTQTLLGLPISGLRDGFKSYFLPGFALASVSMAYLSRVQRTTLLEHLRADYVRTARAKGLSESKVLFKHAWRNSLIPVITFVGLDFGTLLGGAILTETVFNVNGLGRTIELAVRQQDNQVILGVSVFVVLIFLVINLLVDVSYAVLDPRVRYQ